MYELEEVGLMRPLIAGAPRIVCFCPDCKPRAFWPRKNKKQTPVRVLCSRHLSLRRAS